LTCSWCVEITECPDPKYQHYDGECEEPGIFAERWPVAVEEVAEEREF
jgi:hypothetical protein